MQVILIGEKLKKARNLICKVLYFLFKLANLNRQKSSIFNSRKIRSLVEFRLIQKKINEISSVNESKNKNHFFSSNSIWS